jgi:hypothetical protein
MFILSFPFFFFSLGKAENQFWFFGVDLVKCQRVTWGLVGLDWTGLGWVMTWVAPPFDERWKVHTVVYLNGGL